MEKKLPLKFYSNKKLSDNTFHRQGEVKLGKRLRVFNTIAELSNSPVKYVIIGIQEDIGVRANGGRPGTHAAFTAFLRAFCNMQSNHYFSGEEVAVLGKIKVADLVAKSMTKPTSELPNLVSKIDKRVAKVVEHVVSSEKIPIIIGGGHNNSYGNIKGVSSALNSAINCLNIDAHTDLRKMEGRHSGNGFTYAFEEGFLNKYYVTGLQESYTPQYIYSYILSHHERIGFTRFDAMLTHDPYLFESLEEACDFLGDGPCGLEIDLDCIANIPSSAMSPDGFLLREVRQIIQKTTSKLDFKYLHVCEGAPGLISGGERIVGRAIAALVAEFVKRNSNR